MVVKILNDRGKHYGEINLDYDSTHEKVELAYAQTIKPDGRVVRVGKKNIRDVSRYLNYPLYSNARVKIVSMPEVENGCIIDYKAWWEIGNLINQRDFSTCLSLQGYEPVLHQRFSLVVPRDYGFNIKHYNPNYVQFGSDFNPSISEESGKVIYSWDFGSVGEIIQEPSMPPFVEVIPYLAISSFKDWRAIYEWWKPLYADKLSLDEEMEQKLRDLIEEKNSDKQKVKAIYNFCAKEIRYVAVEYGEAGFEPHSAQEIFKNRYGDCKDQAILLVAMLRFAGLKAHPVLITTQGNWLLDYDFPSLGFDHAVACVRIDDKHIFLDPTQEVVSFGDLPSSDQGRGVLIFYDDNYDGAAKSLFFKFLRLISPVFSRLAF